MTLEPGVFDPSEAPWWEFSCGELTTVEQWMRQAALHFARIVSTEEDCGVQVLYTSLDGMTGHYLVTDGGAVVMKDEHGQDISLIVHRGEMTTKPESKQ